MGAKVFFYPQYLCAAFSYIYSKAIQYFLTIWSTPRGPPARKSSHCPTRFAPPSTVVRLFYVPYVSRRKTYVWSCLFFSNFNTTRYTVRPIRTRPPGPPFLSNRSKNRRRTDGRVLGTCPRGGVKILEPAVSQRVSPCCWYRYPLFFFWSILAFIFLFIIIIPASSPPVHHPDNPDTPPQDWIFEFSNFLTKLRRENSRM